MWAAAKRPLFTDCELEVETIPAVTFCEDCGKTYGNVKILLPGTEPQGLAGSGEQRAGAAARQEGQKVKTQKKHLRGDALLIDFVFICGLI